MRSKKHEQNRIEIIKTIFTSPFYLIFALVASVVYYELFRYLILASNKGVFLVTVPIYSIYVLVISSALLIAISIYAVSRSVHAKFAGAEGIALSILTSSFGSLVVGCSCYAPILSSVLYAIGFGTLQVSSAISFLGVYQVWFVVSFIAVNLIFIYYQLGRIIRIGKNADRR